MKEFDLKPGDFIVKEPGDIMGKVVRNESGITDHAAAAAAWLEHFAKLLRAGTAPEDIGWMVEGIGTMMARKI